MLTSTHFSLSETEPGINDGILWQIVDNLPLPTLEMFRNGEIYKASPPPGKTFSFYPPRQGLPLLNTQLVY
jgi:hypothetical protein